MDRNCKMDKRASSCTHFPHQSPHRFPAYFCHRHSQSRIPTLIPNPPCMKNLNTCMKHCMTTGMNSAWIFLQVPFSRTVLPILGTAVFFHAMQNRSANLTIKRFFHAYTFFQQIVYKLGAALCRVSMPCTRFLGTFFNQVALASAMGTANRTQMEKKM